MESLRESVEEYHSVLEDSIKLPWVEIDNGPRTLRFKTKPCVRISRKVLSGLELFALLARVDWDGWKEQATEIWNGFETAELGPPPSRIAIELDMYTEHRVEPVFEMLATSAQDHAQTADVVEARQIVRQILDKRGQVLAELPVQIYRPKTVQLNGFIFKIMQLVASQDLLDRMDGVEKCYRGLRLRWFIPKITAIALSATELQQLAAITAAGVVVDTMGPIKPEVHTHHPEVWTKSLWTLFGIDSVKNHTTEGGVKMVSLARALRVGAMPGIYSAIHASSSICKVSIDPAIDDKSPKKYRQQVWPWIGFALLWAAPGTTHSLESLVLNVASLAVADVDAIRNVISAIDPVAKLFTRAASLATEAVSSSRFVLTDPTKDDVESRVTVESLHVLTSLPVLKKSKEWTCVLLPAWGQAWVHRDDVEAKQRLTKGPFAAKSIARIELTNVRNESKEAVVGLLGLVGGGVKHLVLQADTLLTDGSLGCDNWLSQVLHACPGLEVLEIDRISLHSLQFLLDGFESGKYRLSRFSMDGAKMANADESLRRLFAALGDRRTLVARCLSEFQCSHVDGAIISDPLMLGAMVTMLERNERLRVFALDFVFAESREGEFEDRTAPLQALDKMKISRALAPLAVSQRIAFLSAVTPSSTLKTRARRSRTIEKLDACVLSLIFEMAATCCERRVYLTN